MYKRQHYADAGAFYASLDGFRYLNFYPIMDGGTVKGVACIGIDANRVYIFKIILRVIVIILILLCCVISVRFSMAIFKRISNPLYQDCLLYTSKFGYYNLWYAIRGSNPGHPD